jgi:hypothetical protein
LKLISEKRSGKRDLDIEKIPQSISASPTWSCQNTKRRFLLIHVFGTDANAIADYQRRGKSIGRQK